MNAEIDQQMEMTTGSLTGRLINFRAGLPKDGLRRLAL